MTRKPEFSLPRRLWQKATQRTESLLAWQLQQFLGENRPSLIVFSDGFILPPLELLELCVVRRQPFVTVSHANDHTWWADDKEAERYRAALAAARRCYFVSNGNLNLLKKQIAAELPNAEVVWSPINVAYDASPPFPPYHEGGGLRLANVGRLHPPSKGQDVLIEALSAPAWRDRNWRLNLYGEGNMKEGLQALVRRYGLSDRIQFPGFAKVEDIWATNHALVMPSRYEGLPLTIIEAMLCGRAVIATEVGGNAEVVQDNITGFLSNAPTVVSMQDALEKLWGRRFELEEMGKRAAKHIRQVAPPAPAKMFASALQQLAQL